MLVKIVTKFDIGDKVRVYIAGDNPINSKIESVYVKITREGIQIYYDVKREFEILRIGESNISKI